VHVVSVAVTAAVLVIVVAWARTHVGLAMISAVVITAGLVLPGQSR